jgi:hypothetical protein
MQLETTREETGFLLRPAAWEIGPREFCRRRGGLSPSGGSLSGRWGCPKGGGKKGGRARGPRPAKPADPQGKRAAARRARRF